jgi:hypothetical protein
MSTTQSLDLGIVQLFCIYFPAGSTIEKVCREQEGVRHFEDELSDDADVDGWYSPEADWHEADHSALKAGLVTWRYMYTSGQGWSADGTCGTDWEIEALGFSEVFEEERETIGQIIYEYFKNHPAMTHYYAHNPPFARANREPHLLESWFGESLYAHITLLTRSNWTYDDYSGDADGYVEVLGQLDVNRLDVMLKEKNDVK